MKHVRRIFFTKFGDVREIWAAVGICLVAFLVIIVLVVAPIVGITAITENNKCDTLASYDSVHEYRWGFWSGCRVETSQGYWVDSDNPALIELEQGE